jgi:hypothetical protein
VTAHRTGPEHRTRPLSREELLQELAHACTSLAASGVDVADVSFGWDSNLDIDEMWKDQAVEVRGIEAFLLQAESAGIVTLGKSDVFVAASSFCLTLCHEGDAHVSGEAAVVAEIVRRWVAVGYEPYVVQPLA